MLVTALDLGIGVKEFWEDFTPNGILILARAKVKTMRRGAPAKGRNAKGAPMPHINRIPR